MTAQQRKLRVAQVKFQERRARQLEERARAAGQRGSESHADDEDTTPAPVTRYERFGHRLMPNTTSVTGTDPDVDRVLAERFGQRLPSASQLREVEQALHRRLSGQRSANEKVPVHERPEPVENPRCPLDGVLLEIASYSDTMRPAVRLCRVCGRTERQFYEKGVSLESPAQAVGRSMRDGGLTKKTTQSPVEQHVRTLLRPW